MGLGFLAGAIVGYILLRANLNPAGEAASSACDVVRTILVTTAASLLAGLLAHVVDQLLGLESLTDAAGVPGRCCGCCVLGLIMLPIVAGLHARRTGARGAGRPAGRQRRLGEGPRRVAEPPVAPSRPTTPLGYLSRTLIRGIRSRRGVVKARRQPGAGLRRRLPEPGCGKDQR